MMRTALILLVCVLVASCTKKDFCLQPNAVVVQCGFYYENDSKESVDTFLNGISIFTQDTTYMYYNNDSSVGKVNYFIQSELTEQQLIVRYDDLETADTIWISYDPSLKFISNGCGYQYEYALESVRSTNNVIEEVNITNASVNSQSTEEHLEIIIQ